MKKIILTFLLVLFAFCSCVSIYKEIPGYEVKYYGGISLYKAITVIRYGAAYTLDDYFSIILQFQSYTYAVANPSSYYYLLRDKDGVVFFEGKGSRTNVEKKIVEEGYKTTDGIHYVKYEVAEYRARDVILFKNEPIYPLKLDIKDNRGRTLKITISEN